MSLNSHLVNDLWCVLHVVLSQLIVNGFLEQRVVAVVDVFPGRAGEHVPQGIVKHTTVLPILHALSHNPPQGEHQGVLLPHMGVQIGNLFQWLWWLYFPFCFVLCKWIMTKNLNLISSLSISWNLLLLIYCAEVFRNSWKVTLFLHFFTSYLRNL